jgi:hypothetical protein
LEGVSAIYEFVQRQVEGYAKVQGSLPQGLENDRRTFNNVKAFIERSVLENGSNDYEWNAQVKEQLERQRFLIDIPITEFLFRVFYERPKLIEGALQYFNEGGLINQNDRNFVSGYLLAYEFASRDTSEIAKRKSAEKKSLADLRSEFERYLSTSEKELISFLEESNAKTRESVQASDQMVKEKESEFYKWFDQQQSFYKVFFEEATKNVGDWEVLYRDKLKLEAPAQYWRDRASTLRGEGNSWTKWLFVAIGVGILILTVILLLLTNGRLENLFKSTGSAIKWSVILITIISFLAYAVKVFSKLAFSSYHLVRDAEEREQLTYVYLALKKEKGVDETERHLIMQSLFSRADSGLLKDDGGPTMPSIIDKAIQR